MERKSFISGELEAQLWTRGTWERKGKEGYWKQEYGQRGLKEEGQMPGPLLASRVHHGDRALSAPSFVTVTENKWMLWDPTCTLQEEFGKGGRYECRRCEDGGMDVGGLTENIRKAEASLSDYRYDGR